MNARQVKEMEVEEWMERERYDREPRYPKRAHVHVWGDIENARFTGNPHRKCVAPGCKGVSLDL